MDHIPAIFVGVVVMFVCIAAVADYLKFRKHEAKRPVESEKTDV